MHSSPTIGVLLAFAAFLIWGLSPIYWRALNQAAAFEIILHRMVWSFVVLMPLVLVSRRWREFKKVMSSPRTLLVLLTTSLLVGGNWLIYIWAVNNGRVLQASLGYYINPLVNVLLGVLFLKERLRTAQRLAVLLAIAGVPEPHPAPWRDSLGLPFPGLQLRFLRSGPQSGRCGSPGGTDR